MGPIYAERMRRAHWAVALLFFTCGFGFANWSTRIPSVREQLHLSNRHLGFLLLCTCVGSLISFRLAGALTQRVGSKQLALWGTAGFCLLLNMAPLMPTPLTMGAALLVLGFAAGFMDVSMNAQAVEVEQARGQPILSGLHGVCSLGGLVGAGTGAAAAACQLPLPAHMALISLPLFAAVVWAGQNLLPMTTPPKAAQARPAPRRFNKVLLVLGAIGFCSSVGEGAMRNWVGVYLREDLHTGLGTASLSYGCFSLAMVVGRLSCDRLAKNMATRDVIRVAGGVAAAGLSLGLIINTAWGMMGAAFIVGLGLAPIVPAVFRAGGNLKTMPSGEALATLATMSYGGGLFGPPTIGLVADYGGLRMALAVVVIIAIMLPFIAEGVPRQADSKS